MGALVPSSSIKPGDVMSLCDVTIEDGIIVIGKLGSTKFSTEIERGWKNFLV